MNIKEKIIKIKNNIVAFYTSKTATAYVAIGITSLVGISAIILGSIAVISAITKDPKATTSTTATTVIEDSTIAPATSETETTTEAPEATTEETTTAETTTERTTTTETTTEEATTKKKVEVTTTAPPPPTIAVEDLNIGNASEEETAETKNDNKYKDEFYGDDLEEETEKTTQKPTTATTTKPNPQTASKPTSQQTTAKPNETTTQKPTVPETETPTTSPTNNNVRLVKGIDVSKWNSLDKSPIDWVKVKNSGVEYVIIRAGYRGQSNPKLYEDPYFDEHIQGALSAGLQVGVYFYSQAIDENEALEEASFLLSILGDYKLTYPVCFDWEPVEGSRAKNANLTKDQSSKVARKFLETMTGYGYDTMLYSYHSAIKTYFNNDLLNDYKVWMAYYFNAYKNNGVEFTAGDKYPSTAYPFQMWQYSSTGTVPGISGQVDMNVAFYYYSENGAPTASSIINIPATSYTIKPGENVDYRTGVSGYNCAGINETDLVEITITDSNGKIVTDEIAFSTYGRYSINYTLKDFTGLTKRVTANLIVGDKPSLAITNDTLSINKFTTSYDAMIEALRTNITAFNDCVGNPIATDNISFNGLDVFKHNDLVTGTFQITYVAKDSLDFTTTTALTLIITDEEVETETNTETESNTKLETESDTVSNSEATTELDTDISSNIENVTTGNTASNK